ncbi:TetR family transcriptional regulator [Mucilaginibacter sp. X5P1]|uniref:TetR family transcriptional regulator n=1 Tax=Mucilaginibacter sp. X5P1 TaxID=2723088 RepID=UPI00161430C0|nr:TetR family transcriptional regulator [Mucilaginibacter sp. X5P1]MBB6141844.1 AcrR family transcriptional regulator [Mucilaginibacter sp. X5P1]
MENNQRKKIQIAAAKLFVQKGFHATSIRQVGKAAGVNSSMISYYFKSKELLLLSIFEPSIHDMETIKSHLADSSSTAMLQLFYMIDFYTERVMTDDTGIYLMLQEQSFRSIEGSTNLLDQIKEQQFALFQGIVNVGIQKEAFRQDVNTRMIFYTLIGTIRYIIIEHKGLWLQQNLPAYQEIFRKAMTDANAYLKSLLVKMLLPETQPR